MNGKYFKEFVQEEVHLGSYRKADSGAPMEYKPPVNNALCEAVSVCLTSHANESPALNLDSTKIRSALEPILAEYGNRDLVFVPEMANLPTGIVRNSMRISPELVLTREECSIKLIDFLRIYLNIGQFSKEKVETWSGVPKDMLQKVYEEIVRFFSRLIQNRLVYKQPLALSS